MISISGQVLSAPTAQNVALAEARLPRENVWAFVNRAYPGFGLAGVTWPTGYRPLPRPKLNSFYWPSGASRWACGLFLVHSLDLEGGESGPGIHEAAFGADGDQINRVTLKMATEDQTGETSETLSASVYCLPPIPLARLLGAGGTPDNAGYLLTVVDQRYYWWWVQTPDFLISETAGKTWSDLYAQCGTALNVSIGNDDINAAYLQPSRAINLTYEVIPPVLDAIAYNVGQRVVCTYDGSVLTQNFDTAKAARAQDDEDNPDRAYLCGGDWYVDQF